MRSLWIPVWKKAPFLRLLIPVIIGILLQWYIQFDWEQILLAAVCFAIAFTAFQLLPLVLRFKFQTLQGFLINLLLIVLGLLLLIKKIFVIGRIGLATFIMIVII